MGSYKRSLSWSRNNRAFHIKRYECILCVNAEVPIFGEIILDRATTVSDVGTDLVVVEEGALHVFAKE